MHFTLQMDVIILLFRSVSALKEQTKKCVFVHLLLRNEKTIIFGNVLLTKSKRRELVEKQTSFTLRIMTREFFKGIAIIY